MSVQQIQSPKSSRRFMLKESAALLVGGAAGGSVVYAATPAAGAAPAATPPLPLEVGPARPDGGRPARVPLLSDHTKPATK